VLPEQGQSLGSLVCSRASSRRHGAATSSARAWRLGRLILSVGRGHLPALVATVVGASPRQAVATANAPARPCRRTPAQRNPGTRNLGTQNPGTRKSWTTASGNGVGDGRPPTALT
jgi:hypothetical protein